MPLSIRYVCSLEEVVAPAEVFLRRQAGDLFARPQIVVPTAGVKAWLEGALARRLGARDAGCGDGVVANVGFVTPAAVSSLLEPGEPRLRDDDPWSVERLMFTILEAIAGEKRFASQITRAGGPLLAARGIADRFDHYHFRRPGMILAWEEGRAELSPAASDEGSAATTLLASRDRWQFDLWRAVRERIGSASPPARDRLATTAGSGAVFVAGLQSLSLHQIELLQQLSMLPSAAGSPCEVEVLLAHPSPVLQKAWAEEPPPVSLGVAPSRSEEAAASTRTHCTDPLVGSWLRGTREAQWLLASQGIAATHAATEAEPSSAAAVTPAANASLLARLQHSITTGASDLRATPHEGASPLDSGDHSLLIHRCHDLSRQAEVLYDAIVHAFGELDDLAPHEVVIVSPQIAALAPHLEAEFSRMVKGERNLLGSSDGSISLDLIVADRGIHEIHPAAELLASLLALAGSRCSVDAMLAVAAHPLVQAHFHLDEGDIATWRRCIDHTNIRWGLDADRRERAGLAVPEISAHSWRLGLERMLLGAVVSEGAPEPVLGDVVPLAHVEAAEVTSVAPLVSIFRTIDTLDLATAEPKPVAAWCELLEETLAALAGDDTDELEMPLQQIDALRKAATCHDSATAVAVPFHDVKTLLTGRLTAAVGRQPLLTGAITATSMIPLRGVPFRVVCVAGFDETALSGGESDSDDLCTRQELLGDADPRLELRRSLLDSLLAARDRLVITCTGMDVKNNTTLPLVTPLAELVDFVGRHGVPPAWRQGEPHSAVEIFHPRHACSRPNFVAGDLLPGTVWSHNTAARVAATALGQEQATPPSAAAPIEPPAIIELDWLASFLHDPLWPYVTKTLGIHLWRDDDLEIPATLPLELAHRQQRDLREGYLESLLATDNRRGLADAWATAVRANGDVPVLGYGGDVIEHIQQFSHALLDAAALLNTPLDERSSETIHLDLEGITLAGTLEGWFPAAHSLVFIRPDAQSTSGAAFLKTKCRGLLQLLAARAAGHAVEQAIIFSERENWSPGETDKKGKPLEPVMRRQVILDEAIDTGRARSLLTTLVRLYQQAALRPHGLFGKTAASLTESREAAADAFAAHVDGHSYAQSSEAVVHGLTPAFDAVFPPDDPRLPFFEQFSQLAQIEYNRSRTAYVYAPPAHTA